MSPNFPAFVVAFLVLVILNSLHLVPTVASDLAAAASRWALLTAIAAVGMKTSLQEITKVGAPAFALIVSETLFIAIFMIIGLNWL